MSRHDNPHRNRNKGKRLDRQRSSDTEDIAFRLREALDLWGVGSHGPTSSLSGRGAIAEFEAALSSRVTERQVVGVSSGSAALRVCLEIAGVGPNTDVICAAYDWPAAIAAVKSLGAQPIFAAVTEETFTIDPEDVMVKVTPRTRAVVATHLFGVPADAVRIRGLLEPLGIILVEDCAQAFGARLDHLPVGSIGHLAAFSFGPGKTVDAGEGGALAIEKIADFLAVIRTSQHPVRQLLHGIQPQRMDGFQQRLHPAAAILGLAELRSVDERLRVDKLRAEELRSLLSARQGRLIGMDTRLEPNWYRLPVVLADSDIEVPGVIFAEPGAQVLAEQVLSKSVLSSVKRLRTAVLQGRRTCDRS
jgi:dTDP-4-amino-4,6-dideoxygalactose transaminase